jgi:hypothetical protein
MTGNDTLITLCLNDRGFVHICSPAVGRADYASPVKGYPLSRCY